MNDADGLAHLAEVGFYREVRVKGFDSMLTRTLVSAREQMLKMTTQLSNQIRGLMKTFGLIVPKGSGGIFEGHVRELIETDPGVERILSPVLEAWQYLRARVAELTKLLIDEARRSEQCQLEEEIRGPFADRDAAASRT